MQPQDVHSPEVAALLQTIITREADGHNTVAEIESLRNFTSSSDSRIWRLLELVLSGGPEDVLLDLDEGDAQHALNAIQQARHLVDFHFRMYQNVPAQASAEAVSLTYTRGCSMDRQLH